MAESRHGVHRADRPGPMAVTAILGAVVILVVGAVLAVQSLRPEDSPRPAAQSPTSAAAGVCPGGSIELITAPEITDALTSALMGADCTTVVIVPAEPGDLPGDAVGLASTPVVIAGAEQAAAQPEDWRAALDSGDVRLGDPATDPAAGAALAAALDGSNRRQSAELVVPLAQAGKGRRGRPKVTTEQAALADGARPVAPSAGTPLLSFGAQLAGGGPAEGIAGLLAFAPVTDALVAAGFRVGDRIPEGGVGEIEAVEVSEDAVTEAVAAWTALSVPTRARAVIDVSRSMSRVVGDSTRIGLTVEATLAGLDLFADSAAIGLWAFSHEVGSNNGGEDYAELVPVGHLGDGDQRARLVRAVEGLPSRVGGATALYETTLAAYRAATEDYDPDAVNSVLLLTDGANDDPFSISESQLVAQLEQLYDEERPVRIIAIGITADADDAALERIAEATGGASFVAERPRDIARVFQLALGARTD